MLVQLRRLSAEEKRSDLKSNERLLVLSRLGLIVLLLLEETRNSSVSRKKLLLERE